MDEVEKLFGTLCRRSPGLTFNLLQLLDRIGAAALVQTIYSKHPDVDPGSRRLESSKDKVNAASWRGALKVVGDGILQSCWQRGRQQAVDVLEKHYHFRAQEIVDDVEMSRAEFIIGEVKEMGGTMMRSKGKLVGMSVEEGGDLAEAEVEEEGMERPAAAVEEGEEEEEGWRAAVRASLGICRTIFGRG